MLCDVRGPFVSSLKLNGAGRVAGSSISFAPLPGASEWPHQAPEHWGIRERAGACASLVVTTGGDSPALLDFPFVTGQPPSADTPLAHGDGHYVGSARVTYFGDPHVKISLDQGAQPVSSNGG